MWSGNIGAAMTWIANARCYAADTLDKLRYVKSQVRQAGGLDDGNR